MQKELEKIIDRYQNSQTSLDSYQAIFDFVEAVDKVPGFLDLVEKERLRTIKAHIKLLENKPDYKYESPSKAEKDLINNTRKAIHQMDTCFQYRQLYSVYQHLKRNDLYINSVTLFRFSSPDEPLIKNDKEEYQSYLDKIYKKVLPLLDKEEEEGEIKFKFYSEPKRRLLLGKYKIPIAKHEGNNKAHEVMTHIFVDNKENLKDKFYYSEIAEERLGAEYNSKDKYAYQPYSGACQRINDIIKEATDNKVKVFLKFNHSKIGYVQVNPKYL